jgi:hypothetical protein
MTGSNPERVRGPVESFYAIRRADGQRLGFEEMYSWFEADGPDDWSVAEEHRQAGAEPGVYEMVRMDVFVQARRTYGDPDDLDSLAVDLNAAWNAHRSGNGEGVA